MAVEIHTAGEDAAKAPKAGQKYKRTGDSSTGEVIELQAVFPLDQSIAYLIVEAPHARYRRGLRGTVSFSDLAKNYTLIPSGEPSALYWAGRKFLVLGTVDYQGGRAVRLIEDDGQPSSFGRIDFSFCVRETELRHGSWSADGVRPDVNHRPAVAPHSIDAELIKQRVAAEEKLHMLRCAIAELVGRWSVGSAKEAQLSRVLESVLKENR